MMTTIPNKARKLFQLAKMQIDYLVIEESVEDFSDALDSLSGNVNDYYEKSMERIKTMSSARDQNIIKIMLKWVYFARRPIQVDEMYHILAVKPGNKLATRLQRNVESNMESGLETFIDRSAGLLTIREESQIVSVAHPTVQEYLQTLEATLHSDAEEEISRMCLTYLCLDMFADGYCTSRLPLEYRMSEFPFIAYASRFWGDHVRGKPEQNPALQDLALDFLKNKKLLSSSVQAKQVAQAAERTSPDLMKLMSFDSWYLRHFNEIPSIVVAAKFGLISLVNRLIEDGAGVDEKGGRDEKALYQASLEGHEPVVKLLLDKGADLNDQDGDYYYNALEAASHNGHIGVVALLLTRGGNVNPKRKTLYGSALNAASASGHVQIVAMLLNEGAEVNLDDEPNIPLHGAAAWGDVAIIKMLLDKGARINARGNKHGNALTAASARGNIEAVMLLLQNEAPKVKINVEGGPQYDALHAASGNGYEAIAGLLIRNGTDVNAHHALQEASDKGHVAVVKLLLQNGADVNAQGEPSFTARQAAATYVLDPDFFSGNSLQAASRGGHEAIVRLLLKNGAEVNAPRGGPDYLHIYALQSASACGIIDVVRLLQDEGADVNAEGGSEYNALWVAARWGWEDVVRLLLERGATVNWGEEGWVSLRRKRRRVNDATLELMASYPRH